MSTINEQALDWMARQAAAPLTAAEQAELAAWCEADARHLGALARAQVIEYAVSRPEVQEQVRVALPGAQLAREPVRQVRGKRGDAANQRRYWLGMAVAASVAVLAVMALNPLGTETIVINTAHGEIRNTTLADQSVATANSDSLLEVRYDRGSRRVALRQGEAWFSVAKDPQRPFIVEAGNVQVRAVGTAFSVRLHGANADVVVTEGTVQVSGKAGQALALSAGQQAEVPQAEGVARLVSDPEAVRRKLAWREGKLMFKRETLAQAAADFNRYNQRQIVIADERVRDRPLLGQYPIHAPEQFARDMGLMMKVPVSITPEQIRIGAEPVHSKQRQQP
jgi:transmembrane sensor